MIFGRKRALRRVKGHLPRFLIQAKNSLLANSYIYGNVTILEEYQDSTPPFEKLGFGLQLMTPLFGCPA
jgi:hypothetical protein